MTWEIALGLFALASFVIGIGTIVAKQSSNNATLTVLVETLRQALDKFETKSTETHKELSDKTQKNSETLIEHEGRIHSLEEWRKGEER